MELFSLFSETHSPLLRRPRFLLPVSTLTQFSVYHIFCLFYILPLSSSKFVPLCFSFYLRILIILCSFFYGLFRVDVFSLGTKFRVIVKSYCKTMPRRSEDISFLSGETIRHLELHLYNCSLTITLCLFMAT